jgi:hypothetical protein
MTSSNSEGLHIPTFPFGDATVGVTRRTPFVTSRLGDTWGELEDGIRVRCVRKTALSEHQALKIRYLGPPVDPPPNMFPNLRVLSSKTLGFESSSNIPQRGTEQSLTNEKGPGGQHTISDSG